MLWMHAHNQNVISKFCSICKHWAN